MEDKHWRSSFGKLSIDNNSNAPVYKQLIQGLTDLIHAGEYKEGDFLPSMNELSAALNISKETVKKAYAILRQKGEIDSTHGKGFYVISTGEDKIRVMMLFDKLSNYKFVLYHSFIAHVGENVSSTIYLHNQDVDLFSSLLDEHLGNYDYYIITPHFPLNEAVQARVLKCLKKIPNRKLILLDRNLSNLSGHFGAIYQDFNNDVYNGLLKARDLLRKYRQVHVVSTPASLYSHVIRDCVSRFCADNNLKYTFHEEVNDNYIKKGGIYIILNSQYDVELIGIIRSAKAKGLKIGIDIGILSYNESPVNEIILDGLSSISTDFKEMGKLAAEMIKTGKFSKIHNKFDLVIRNTL